MNDSKAREPNISSDVVIMTRQELDAIKLREFQRGVERGAFEESMARSGVRESQPAPRIERQTDAE